MENKEITLNEISHFTYCRRQWGLMFQNAVWLENTATVEGKIMHENADDPFFIENRKGQRISRALPVYSETENLYGICDAVVFTKNEKGVYIKELGWKASIEIVEYKRGNPESNEKIDLHDALQLTAQMFCVNEMFGTHCEGSVYYSGIRRRIRLNDYDAKVLMLKNILQEIRECYEKQHIPTGKFCAKCKGCSIAAECLPKTLNVKNFFEFLSKESR